MIKLAQFGGILLCTILVFTCAGMLVLEWVSNSSFGQSQSPPPSAKNPPAYPGSQEVIVKDTSGSGMYDKGEMAETYQIVTFKTIDKTNQVLAFYQNALQRDGWHPSGGQEVPGTLRLLWFSNTKPPEMYTFDVITKSADPSQTDVELRLGYFGGY